ncbi:MAG: sulfatase-like hydrolase/transferase [bacterium]|nr:sulfatase-like hydrolase/transferase [bacterium]
MDKPNILLISTDTQRCDTLNCMGYPKAISPHLDRLAAEGVMFTQAHTNAPVCGPTRCSLMTGLHPPVHGSMENGIARREGLLFFTDRLKEVGYTNVMAGKTHFGAMPDSFDIDYSAAGGKSGVGNNIYAAYLKEHGYEGNAGKYPHSIPEDLFFDAFVTTKTIDGIEEARKQSDGPFFAFCSMLSPHGPLDPPGKWGTLYTDEMLPPPPKNPETDGEPEHAQRLLALRDRPRYTAEEIEAIRKLYYGLSSYCDDQVGRLMTYLDENGLREETLVIFTSDHGIDLYDHGFDNKHQYYDNTWRVPFVMSMPGTLAAGETRDFVMWNDIATTILGAAGLSEPTMQGFDVFTAAKNGERSPRRCAVGTLFKSCALATKRWKLEYYLEEGQARLFDREKDPDEYNDLSGSDAHREVLWAMKEALLSWRSDLHDIAYLHRYTSGGGPVAKRVGKIVPEMRGTDAEDRLNEKVEAIDAQFDG